MQRPHRCRATLFAMVIGASAGPLAGIGQAQTPAPSKKFRIVCTTGMVADIVRNVAGDRAVVTGIIGEGVDPHLYQATRSDIAKLLKADIIFYSGLMLEPRHHVL